MKKTTTPITETKQGFTIIEVMLVLAVTGVMLIGVIAGTYTSIATQRYNDSVRSFSEFLRQVYAEVISPQSLGEGNSDEEAIYGKIAVFGIDEDDPNSDVDTIYTATLVGDTKPPRNETNFITELGTVNAHLYCPQADDTSSLSSVDSYTPMWEAKIETPNENGSNQPMRGTLIIARSPASGTIHTVFTSNVYPINDNCTGASNNLKKELKENPDAFSFRELDFCIVSEDSRIIRDIRLAADGRNSSAINLLATDGLDGEIKCHQR